MNRMKITGAAPMPRDEEDVRNSMKLYTYLVCISGLANYPENTRMFRQKNIIPSRIKEILGLDPKTTKKYLYQLERNHLITYRGQQGVDEEEYLKIRKECEEEYEKKEKTPKTLETTITNKIAIENWNRRNKKEKDGIYFIPRPYRWTPIPEITLEKLNQEFQCTELELKLFILCSSYRDKCVNEGKSFHSLTFEGVKNALQIKKTGSIPDREIRSALFFLQSLGLIEFKETCYPNLHGKSIPSFQISEVNYYINYTIDFVEQVDDDMLKEIQMRIQEVINEINN